MKKQQESNVKRVRIGVAGLIVAVVLAVIVIDRTGGDGDADTSGESGDAVALSETEFIAQAGELPGTVFWVGARPGTDSYEMTSTADGKVFVRYLTEGAEAGVEEPNFVTVGTYPVAGAKQALRSAKKNSDMELSRHDGFEMLSDKSSNNAYVVFDSEPDLQVEVFSPNPGEAGALAESGALTPVG